MHTRTYSLTESGKFLLNMNSKVTCRIRFINDFMLDCNLLKWFRTRENTLNSLSKPVPPGGKEILFGNFHFVAHEFNGCTIGI